MIQLRKRSNERVMYRSRGIPSRAEKGYNIVFGKYSIGYDRAWQRALPFTMSAAAQYGKKKKNEQPSGHKLVPEAGKERSTIRVTRK
eukprot:scaffold4214_cov168-Ochromonas_danica.AAC.3